MSSILWSNAIVIVKVNVAISREWFCGKIFESVSSPYILNCGYNAVRLHTVVLRDLVTRRLIMVEVMFSIEATDMLNVTIERNRSAKGREKRSGLEFLQHNRKLEGDRFWTSWEQKDIPVVIPGRPSRTKRLQCLALLLSISVLLRSHSA